MAKKVIKIISIILIVIAITSLFQTQSLAAGMSDVTDNVNFWKPANEADDSEFISKVNDLIGVIRTVGTVVSLLTLIVIGIKFITGSVEQKAEYKKTMIPWLVGAIMIFGITNITTFIYEIVKEMF